MAKETKSTVTLTCGCYLLYILFCLVASMGITWAFIHFVMK